MGATAWGAARAILGRDGKKPIFPQKTLFLSFTKKQTGVFLKSIATAESQHKFEISNEELLLIIVISRGSRQKKAKRIGKKNNQKKQL